MLPKVLLVDDEPNILNSLRRQLQRFTNFEVETALSGRKGLEIIKASEPFSVVVSDMRMPEMDGTQFLKEVQTISPNTTRIMLTGDTGQSTAVEAINTGSIFRFLMKPCSTVDLAKAIEDGVKQYNLLSAEKELLQKTLSGSVKLLTDILSIIDPIGFGESAELRESLRRIARRLGHDRTWDLELAGMLSNIGFVVLPSVVLVKLQSGEMLSEQEERVLGRVPEVGHRLLANIPRLESVAKVVAYQNKHFDGSGYPKDEVAGEDIPLNARILKIAKKLQKYKEEGLEEIDALFKMKKDKGVFDQKIIESLVSEKTEALGEEEVALLDIDDKPRGIEVKVKDLEVGQTVLKPIVTDRGQMLLKGGTQLTEILLERILNYSQLVGVREPLMIDGRVLKEK